MKIKAVVLLSAILASCQSAPDVPPQQFPMGQTINALKCNLGAFFANPENIANADFAIKKVGVTVTYLSSVAAVNSQSIGVTVPFSGGTNSIGASASNSTNSSSTGRFIPSFEFGVLKTSRKVIGADGKPVDTPYTKDQIEAQAKGYSALIEEDIGTVCDGAIDIVFPDGLAAAFDPTSTDQEEETVDVKEQVYSYKTTNADDESVESNRTVALTQLLEAYRNEFSRIVDGQPEVTAGDFTIQADLSLKVTEEAGASLTVLVLSLSGSSSSIEQNSVQIKLLFDVAKI
jgi:hypothetical protein